MHNCRNRRGLLGRIELKRRDTESRADGDISAQYNVCMYLDQGHFLLFSFDVMCKLGLKIK